MKTLLEKSLFSKSLEFSFSFSLPLFPFTDFHEQFNFLPLIL